MTIYKELEKLQKQIEFCRQQGVYVSEEDLNNEIDKAFERNLFAFCATLGFIGALFFAVWGLLWL